MGAFRLSSFSHGTKFRACEAHHRDGATRDKGSKELAGGAVLFVAANYVSTPETNALNGTPQRRVSQPARIRRRVADDILRAASTVHEAGEEPNWELIAKVVLPVLSIAEEEFGQAPSLYQSGRHGPTCRPSMAIE